MRLQFLGAAGEVTGSCTLVETERARVLVDLGLFQGSVSAEARNRRQPAPRMDRLDAIVLTHAHLDHSGRMPLLGQWGYSGRVHATPATIDLCDILWKDSARIQESDAERLSRRRARAGRPPARPLYTTDDAEKALNQLFPAPYHTPIEIADGVTIEMLEAGHILGSASVRMTVRSQGQERIIVFSGDIGPYDAPLLRDPAAIEHADLVLLESTYGNRDHKPIEPTLAELVQIMDRSRAVGGKVLIPSFAVGRAQQLIYYIGGLRRDGKLFQPSVILDSPMAVRATELYRRHRDLFDDDAWAIINAGDTCLDFPGLRFTRTSGESASLNNMAGEAVIIAGSGMCNGGRILHHFRHHLPKPTTQVVFVGYQGQRTLGRRLVDGARDVRIFGDRIAVGGLVHTLGGFSAHAGQTDLLRWLSSLAPTKPRVLLNHGEDGPRAALATKIRERFAIEPTMPGPLQGLEF